MKILVPGGNGQIGWELGRRDGDEGLEIITLSHERR